MFRRLTPTRAAAVTITVNDVPLVARAGDSIAAALLANGHTVLGRHADGRARTPFCLNGVCQQCWLVVDETTDVPACTTQVREGMRVRFQDPSTDDKGDSGKQERSA